jgi:hypothetical protein
MKFKFLPPTLSLLVLSGCYLEPAAVSPKKELMKIELDIFAARGFLGGSDYEHYTLKDGLLWRECGSIPLKKNATETGTVPKTLQVRQKRLESLKGEDQAPIIEALMNLKNESSKEVLKQFPPPQSVKSMSDGGMFELKSGNLQFITTVDAVGDAKPKPLDKVQKLFETVRGVGPVICEAQTFFGMGRK